MHSRTLLVVAVLTAALLTSVTAQASQITLRLAYWIPESHPIITDSMKPWAEAITEASGGTIQFQHYPAGQLGSADRHYDLVAGGVADVAWVNPGFNPGRWPVITLTQLPFLVADTRGASAAMTRWYRQYAEDEMPEAKVCLIHSHYPLAIHSTKRVVTPDDLQGLLIRPSNSLEAMLLSEAGASNVRAAYPQAQDLISRGVIDATTGVAGSLIKFGIDRVTQYHLDIPLSIAAYTLLINRGTYDRMTPEQQAVIDNHCTPEAAVAFTRPLYEFERNGMEELKARDDGREVVVPTKEQLAQWRDLVPPVKERWAEQVREAGHDPEKVYNGLIDELRKEGALLQ